MSVNKVILVGRLGSDPEVRTTSGGQNVANFNLATDESWKDRNGEKQKRTEWHRLVLWGKLADIAQDFLHKGDQIFVEGRIQSRKYTNQQDSAEHTVVEIVVNELKMLSTKQTNEPAPVRQAAKPAARPAKAPEPVIGDEDIPF